MILLILLINFWMIIINDSPPDTIRVKKEVPQLSQTVAKIDSVSYKYDKLIQRIDSVNNAKKK